MKIFILGALGFFVLGMSATMAVPQGALWTYEVLQMPDNLDSVRDVSLKDFLKARPKITRKDFGVDCEFVGNRSSFPAGDLFASWTEEVSVVCKRNDVIVRSGPAKCIFFDTKSKPKPEAYELLLALAHQRLNAEAELAFDFPGSDGQVDIARKILTVRVRCQVDQRK